MSYSKQKYMQKNYDAEKAVGGGERGQRGFHCLSAKNSKIISIHLNIVRKRLFFNIQF